MSALTENEIYGVLLDAMLSAAADKGLDTSEGSVGFDLLAPAAMAMTELYLRIEEAQEEGFADTASLENLKRRAAERGISYREAVPPQIELALIADGREPIGELSSLRFALGELTFYAVEQTGEDRFLLACETACAIGDAADEAPVYLGSDPNIRGASLVRVVNAGRNAETAQELRSRFFSSVRSAAFAGNRAAYAELALAVPGVGGCKAARADIETDGCNVLLTVISDDYGVPEQSVIDAVQAAVDDTLPLCHVCSVRPVATEAVTVAARIVKQSGAESEDVRSSVETQLGALMRSVGERWAQEGSATLRSSEIFTAILAAPGVLDVYSVTAKRGGQTFNSAVFDAGTVPVVGAVTLTEVAE